ncbi:efflux RND transporter periplasmic adaptor subunit [Raoultibacter massiliensis]|uniref:efflux RND transporter periplasmic adaptor subunit n=1 Tax=Raoultibacter massiliensis TaxID=1852371 RepID=UPI000C81F831|nr:HlyD family efflux transporter periplasmic adaptor subunit [Raoultibacter massiliensis]
MAKTIGKAAVVLLLVAVLGGIVYVLIGQDAAASGAAEPLEMPTALVTKGTIEKLVTGPGEVKPAKTEKLKMAKWRYFKSSPVPLNERIPAGTSLVDYTYGDSLVAPYDLVVLSKNLPEKERDELTEDHYVEVARVDSMHVELEVPETDIADLSVGQAVEVKLAAKEDEAYEGTVASINEVGTYGATGSKYKVTIEIPNDGSILIGMSANASIKVAEAADVLTVPVSAVTDGGEGVRFVLVQHPDGSLEPVEVETGLSDGTMVEVGGNLNEGDEVLLNDALSSGASGEGEGDGSAGGVSFVSRVAAG